MRGSTLTAKGRGNLKSKSFELVSNADPVSYGGGISFNGTKESNLDKLKREVEEAKKAIAYYEERLPKIDESTLFNLLAREIVDRTMRMGYVPLPEEQNRFKQTTIKSLLDESIA